MSDPFAEIDKEVNLDKIKSFFYQYKKVIIIILLSLFIIPSSIAYLNYKKNKKNLEISGYYIEIISLLQTDEKKAIEEFDKLKHYNHKGYNLLADIIISKINLKNGNIDEAKKLITKLKERKVKNSLLNKLISYYQAQILLDLNNKIELEKIISELLSYGGNWALLGHEIRGHYNFKNGNYNLATKDFKKITNEQTASNSLRARAREMLDSIIIYNKSDN